MHVSSSIRAEHKVRMETYNQPPSSAADDIIQAPSASADFIPVPSAAADLIQAPSASADPHQIRLIGSDVSGGHNVLVWEVTCACGQTHTVKVSHGTYLRFTCLACKGEYALEDVPGCENIVAAIRQYPDFNAFMDAAIFKALGTSRRF